MRTYATRTTKPARSSPARRSSPRQDRPPAVQTKLTVSSQTDPLEQEADAAARQAMSFQPASALSPADPRAPGERAMAAQPYVQRRAQAAGGPVDPGLESSIAQARGGGQPLSSPLRGRFEQAFGADFGRVKVHTNYQADTLNRSLQARAFTTGQDVFFRQGEYQPGSPSGQELLAHELAHVVQQQPLVTRSPASGPYVPTVTPSAPGLGPIQRKAYLGPNYAAPADLSKPAVRALHEDDTVRRFKDQPELEAFAANPSLPGVGTLPEHGWVHLPDHLLVLGENHGDQKAPALIKATHITRYRYEGFSTFAPDRLAASQALTDHVAAESQARLAKLGLTDVDDGGTHEAESAMPKCARALPEVMDMAAAQKRKNAAAEDLAGADLGAGYSLKKAALHSFLTALVYAQAHGAKFWGNKLESFNWWSSNAKAVDAAIVAVQASLDAQQMPNLVGLAITTRLDELTTAFEAMAKSELGLAEKKDVAAFKGTLDLNNEAQVTRNARAEESDYLRDASMIRTIRAASQAGDRLFVIGDAHRKKLQPLIEAAGLSAMKDTAFLSQQEGLNQDAHHGLTTDIRALAKSKLPSPPPKRVGELFTLGALNDLPHCAWDIEGAEATQVAGQYKATAEQIFIRLIWNHDHVEQNLEDVYYKLSPQ